MQAPVTWGAGKDTPVLGAQCALYTVVVVTRAFALLFVIIVSKENLCCVS